MDINISTLLRSSNVILIFSVPGFGIMLGRCKLAGVSVGTTAAVLLIALSIENKRMLDRGDTLEVSGELSRIQLPADKISCIAQDTNQSDMVSVGLNAGGAIVRTLTERGLISL